MEYYSDNTNLAYDLSRFDAVERRKRAKEREEEKARLRLSERSVSKSGSVVKIVLVVAVFFSAFSVVNYYNTKRYDVSRLVSQQEAALAEAQDDNAILQSRLDSLVNISYIEQYAQENLGMTKVSSSQKKYVSVNTEDLIERTEDESLGFVGSVKKWFNSILEYIGF